MSNRSVAFAEVGARVDVSKVVMEVSPKAFKDERLGRRFQILLQQLSEGVGRPIPFACQDWANVKAAYRFLSNPRVSEGDILAGHFAATRDRASQIDGPILVLHDTTEFSFKRSDVAAIGITKLVDCGADAAGRRRSHTLCGVMMHSSLVVTPEGVPLGLGAAKFWTRSKFHGANELKRHVNPTRVPIAEKESIRWIENLRHSTQLIGAAGRCVHIGDRESDIYELFCEATASGTHFVFRTCVNRLAADGSRTIAHEMAETRCKGLHRVVTRDRSGNLRQAVLEIKYRRVHVLPPIGKQAHYPSQDLTVIHAVERSKRPKADRIEWKLVTDLPVTSRAQAIEKLRWYAMRWKIEVFHKVLKSGCRVEDSKLRTANRLVNLISALCIVSWRVFWVTMLSRFCPTIDSGVALTIDEKSALQAVRGDLPASPDLRDAALKIARLGGYLARANDLPPGNTVMWRGMGRLADIVLGLRLAREMGN